MRAAVVIVTLSTLLACERQPVRATPGAPAEPGVPNVPAPAARPAPDEPAVAEVPPPAPLPAEVAPKPRSRSTRKFADALLLSIRKRVEGEGTADDDTRRALQLAAGKAKRFRKLVTAAYQQRDSARWLGQGDTLSEEGRAVVDLLLDVESHGLEPSPYPLSRLKQSLETYEQATKDLATALQADPEGAVARLAVILASFEPADGETYSEQRKRVSAQLLEQGFSDDDPYTTYLQDLDTRVAGEHAARAALRKALVDMDVAAVQGFLQYDLDFKYAVVAHPYDGGPDAASRAPDKYKNELLADFQAAAKRPAAAMRALWPKHPHYEKARAALARYRALDVPAYKLRGQLKKGMKGPKVVELKQRLAAQGYFEGPTDDVVFGEDLEAAVKRFQAHHQLRVDGVVRDAHGAEGAVKRRLAEPMKDRVRQLALSLQRWRESNITKKPSDFYFRVNIPQFEVEVWDGSEMVRKHRIVVGNNQFETDADHGRKGHLNRTALLSSAMSTVVLNPVWNVPERIRIQEVLVEAAKDPTYLEKHNYKRRVLSNGTEQIYQESGAGNALGQVKLLFPNEYAIYMHDTPKKALFDRTLRAFSHGCMRLHDPVSMATYVLEREGLLERSKVQDILASKKERAFRLKNPIPVHIEYNTVAFEPGDDEPVFLNDVYGYDEAYWKGELPVVREEAIPVVKSELPMVEWERSDDPRDDDESEVPAAPSFDVDDAPPAKPGKNGGEPAPREGADPSAVRGEARPSRAEARPSRPDNKPAAHPEPRAH